MVRWGSGWIHLQYITFGCLIFFVTQSSSPKHLISKLTKQQCIRLQITTHPIPLTMISPHIFLYEPYQLITNSWHKSQSKSHVQYFASPSPDVSRSPKLRVSFARTSFTFSYSLFTRAGSELVPSEGKVMQTLVGSMVGAGAAVEEGRSEMKPVAERIRPQPVRKS